MKLSEEQKTALYQVLEDGIGRHYFDRGAHTPTTKEVNVYGMALASLLATDIAEFLEKLEETASSQQV